MTTDGPKTDQWWSKYDLNLTSNWPEDGLHRHDGVTVGQGELLSGVVRLFVDHDHIVRQIDARA